ncbi:MAG: tRNA pseudouridine(55) synthase TruB [Propionibacteriaceae bacterium]|jgi:tRNA pseudouridine55 synthase|nr:tRNA pseudouridine(55) synthase TruB [Propionibacteriaceae bacterium]
MSDAAGFLVIDKPPGLTSQQVVSRVKRALGAKKAGHAGTLDPMATGVLVVGVGRATRLLGYLSGHDKRYEATIRLGQATTTDDAEGEPLGEPADTSQLTAAQIDAALASFVGEIEQVPASVSAIKVDGKRAYARVRAGEDVSLPPRKVRVFSLERIPTPSLAEIQIQVHCSSGTYIRAIARDLGQLLGVGGHLTALRRTSVSAFDLSQAVSLDEVDDTAELISLSAVAREVFDSLEVGPAEAADVGFGRAISNPGDTAELVAIFADGEFLALYAPEGLKLKPVAVFLG